MFDRRDLGTPRNIRRRTFSHSTMNARALSLRIGFIALFSSALSVFADPPKAGDLAPDFTLNKLRGEPVRLSDMAQRETVVLVVLRGWPGYQCPICSRQVHEYVSHAAEFAKLHAQVVMVYPGPAEKLHEHAEEFLRDKSWPEAFTFIVDPDYTFTRLFDLRWEAPKETAYPSTFILSRDRRVQFAHVSRQHGDRISAPEALKALQELKAK